MNQEQAHKEVHVFISHIKEEDKIALTLKDFLIRDFLGWIVPFVSSEDLDPGVDWLEGILESLQKTKILLLMCSPKSINEPWLYFEAGATFVQGKPVIPICYGGLKISDLPPQFGRKQAITLEDPNHIISLYKVITSKLPSFTRIPAIDYQARSQELMTLVSIKKQGILFLVSENLRDRYRQCLNGKILPHLELDFADYADVDSKMVGNSYKEKYAKIVYHHPHPEKSDPCYVKLVERLKKDQASLPLITFSDGKCEDSQVSSSYDNNTFANMLSTLIQRING